MSGKIMNFDSFVNEAKKDKWIGKIDMKKGALKKEIGKEKLTKNDITAEEKKLAKKDKDKKKPGFQLDKKDAKKHKRLTLAKNLMKASGAIDESRTREKMLAEAKEDLVKIHEIVEKMIAQTSKKKESK